MNRNPVGTKNGVKETPITEFDLPIKPNAYTEDHPRTLDEMQEYDDKIFMSPEQRTKIRETARKRELSQISNPKPINNSFKDYILNDPSREMSRSLDFKLYRHPILATVKVRVQIST